MIEDKFIFLLEKFSDLSDAEISRNGVWVDSDFVSVTLIRNLCAKLAVLSSECNMH